jgi:tetratricopeptide (TPR) repeat protein
MYRKRFPLAAFGVLTFLLLIAPVASFVPIRDVLSERRVYLPMIGLLLVCCEGLRRLRFQQIVQVGGVVVAIFAVLTYMRAEVWANPLALWGDAVSKSPNKYRPRFQLAYAQFERGQCPAAAQSYEAASHLKAVDNEVLVDWALALDCMGRQPEAIDKLKQASLIRDTAHVHSEIARVYMRQRSWQDALTELAVAERMDPNYDMIYAYRGNIYQIAGDRLAAAKEFQRALQLNPDNQVARDALLQMQSR